jgi:tricorn protease-like protein
MNGVTSSGYLRYPHIHGDQVVFVAEDDIWLAPAGGGRAWKLSADSALVSYPRFSRDGSAIAWTSERDGPPEVYLTDPEGSATRRLTYWGDNKTRVTGWTRHGEVLAVSATGQPENYLSWAYAVPVEGAPPRRLPFGPVTDLALEDAGSALLTGRMNTEPAAWKRYRGGTRGKLWIASERDPLFTRVLAELDGQFSSPMLIGGRLFFLSDHEGTGNIYSCTLDGTGISRHTDHDGMYARNPATDGQRIVYHVAGDIWILDGPDAPAPRRLELTLGSPAAARTPKLISARDHLGSLNCDRTGQASVVEVRGTVHWLTHRDGPARALLVDARGVGHRRRRRRRAADRVRHRCAGVLVAGRRAARLRDGAGGRPGRDDGGSGRARRRATGRGCRLRPGQRAGGGGERAGEPRELVSGLGVAGLVPARPAAAAPHPHRPGRRPRDHRRDRRPVHRHRSGVHARRPVSRVHLPAQLRPGV